MDPQEETRNKIRKAFGALGGTQEKIRRALNGRSLREFFEDRGLPVFLLDEDNIVVMDGPEDDQMSYVGMKLPTPVSTYLREAAWERGADYSRDTFTTPTGRKYTDPPMQKVPYIRRVK